MALPELEKLDLAFGPVPVDVQPGAASLLSSLPWSALDRVLSAIRSWAAENGVRRVKVFTFEDPEDRHSAIEVVVELVVEGGVPEVLDRWKALASAVDQAKAAAPENDRRRLDKHLGIHLAWGEEQ